jgi:hypothetical protein
MVATVWHIIQDEFDFDQAVSEDIIFIIIIAPNKSNLHDHKKNL